MPLGHLFKSKEELASEQKKQQKRELRDATRGAEKLQVDLERQERDIEAQIKQAAKKNDTELAKVLAKQLIKVRQQRSRAVGAKSKIGSMANHAAAIQANEKLASVMASSAAAMSKVNQQLRPEQTMKQVQQFQEETTKLEMGEQAFEELFEELFEGEDEQADQVMQQVLDEIGLDTSQALSRLASSSQPVGEASKASSEAKQKAHQ